MYGSSARPSFYQGTLQYALNNNMTANFGLVGMSSYQSTLLGGAFNTVLGAFALNTRASRFTPPNGADLTGSSYDASYTIMISPTRTNLSFVAYRYDTEYYYSLSSAALMLAGNSFYQSKLRERTVISITQSLNNKSSVSFFASDQGYWDRSEHNVDFQLYFGYRFKNVNLTFGGGHTSAGATGTASSRFNIGLNIPIGSANRTTNTTTNYLHDDISGDTSQINVSGGFGEENEYNYGVSASQSDRVGSSVGLNGSWRTGVGTLGASTTRADNSTQDSLSFSGGLVLHGGGLTLAPAVGDTYAIVDAGEAIGARVANGTLNRIDSSGFAIVPYLSPYRNNTFDLDLRNVSLDVEMESTSAQVAPRAGSAVVVKFKGRSGRAALIALTADAGLSVPLGAQIFDENNAVVGVVGQGRMADIRVGRDHGSLLVSWGEGQEKTCQFDYALKAKSSGDTYARGKASCRAPMRNDPNSDPGLILKWTPTLAQLVKSDAV
jgi:outer membrane usher protein